MKLDKKLGKLKMPTKRKGMDLSDLMPNAGDEKDEDPDTDGMSPGADADAGGSDDSESDSDEGPEGSDSGDESSEHSDPAALEHVSDDELMAEIKKRGLMKQLEKGGDAGSDMGSEHSDPAGGDDQSMYR